MNRLPDSKTFSRNLESKLLLARIENHELRRQLEDLRNRVDVAEEANKNLTVYVEILSGALGLKFA